MEAATDSLFIDCARARSSHTPITCIHAEHVHYHRILITRASRPSFSAHTSDRARALSTLLASPAIDETIASACEHAHTHARAASMATPLIITYFGPPGACS